MRRFGIGRPSHQQWLGLLSVEGLVSEKLALDTVSSLRSLPGEPPAQGLILRISSGGGSLGAAQAIAEGLESVSAELRIPIVASVLDVALSAGFYVALAADRIVATGGSALGGAGGIIRVFSGEDLLARLGIRYEGIASGQLKDALFPAAGVTTEQRSSLQAVADDCADQFLDEVARRRPGCSEATLKLLADGRIMTGKAALGAGLVDGVGGLLCAISVCAELAGLTAPRLRILGETERRDAGQAVLPALVSDLRRLFPF